MNDITRLHLLLKFKPKIYKYLVTSICLKFLGCQKTYVGPLRIKLHSNSISCGIFWNEVHGFCLIGNVFCNSDDFLF